MAAQFVNELYVTGNRCLFTCVVDVHVCVCDGGLYVPVDNLEARKICQVYNSMAIRSLTEHWVRLAR